MATQLRSDRAEERFHAAQTLQTMGPDAEKLLKEIIQAAAMPENDGVISSICQNIIVGLGSKSVSPLAEIAADQQRLDRLVGWR